MSWQQITVTLSAADVERAEALLRLAGASAVALADDGDDPVLEPPPGAIEVWPRVRLSALFDRPVDAEMLAALLESDVDIGTVSTAALTEQDWIQGLQQTVRAMRFGDRLHIVPADEPAAASHADALHLNMGLAFGTGRHPTTRLCLEWLAAADVDGRGVLDYGCGSGILALAALKLGAARAWATDNDEQAIVATAANARLNGMLDRLWLGTPAQLPSLEADLVVANILAGTLQALAGDFAQCQRPGGDILLSGVLTRQADAVRDAFAPHYTDFETAECNEWVRITARRRD